MNILSMLSTIFILKSVYITSACLEYSWDNSETPAEATDRGCKADISYSNTDEKIIWPPTPGNEYALSNPRCIDENKRFIRRKCTNNSWKPAEGSCDKIQKSDEYLYKCSEGYELINGVCVLITESAAWSDVCFKTGSNFNLIDFPQLLSPIYYRIKQFWLPARQMNEYEPFVWLLLGEKWKKRVDDTIENISKGNMCLSVELEYVECSVILHKYKAMDCSVEMPMLCVENTNVLPLSCPDGFYTTVSTNRQHSCYGFQKIPPSLWVETFPSRRDALYVDAPRVTGILQEVKICDNKGKQMCWLALQKINETFYWQNGSEVKYVNWDVKEDYSETYGTIHSNGTWGLQSNTTYLECYASAFDNIVQKPEIILKFYPHLYALELTLYSPKSFFNFVEDISVNCFTDAGLLLYSRVDINKKWESDWPSFHDQQSLNYTPIASKAIYEVVLENYPGNYWCEGIMLKTLELIRSESVFAYKRYYSHIYSLISYIPTDMLYTLQISEGPTLFKHDYVEAIRLQKILNVTEERALTIIQMILKEPWDTLPNSEDIIKYYNIVKKIVKRVNSVNESNVHIASMNSTLYCIPEEYIFENGLAKDNLTWDVAQLRSRITPSQLCLQNNGLPVYRACIGDTIFGGVWQSSSENCDPSITPSETTRQLFGLSGLSIENITCTECITDKVHNIVSNTNLKLFIPADIYYIALIFEKVSKLSSRSNKFYNRQNVSDIISKISGMNENTVKLAQLFLNSTNIITHSIQRFLEIIPIQDSALNNTDDGLMIIRSPEYIYQISNPTIKKNISGLALVRRNNSNLGNLDDYDIVPMSLDQELEVLLEMRNLDLSIWIPRVLLRRINETSPYSENHLMIIVSIYNNDIFFKENRTDTLADKVVSISIPGFGPNLPLPLTMLFRQNFLNINLTNTSETTCSYWNYQPKNEDVLGKWYTDGCTNTMTHGTGEDKFTVCACSHLTNFGQLITGASKTGYNKEEYERHEQALNIITLIGCSLSIIGLLGIFVMAIIFKSWRRKTGTKVLLHLSVAIAMEMFIIFLFNVDAITITEDTINSPYSAQKISCVVTGTVLHYSVLASFCWMIIIAFMQYLRYVRVLGVIRPINFVKKSAFIAWGCPLIPVILILLIDYNSYLPKSDFEDALCYPSDLALILGVILPVAIIVLINLVIYAMILLSIIRKPKEISSRHSDSKLLSAQLRLSLFLFSLLGLTWMFGLADAVIGDIIFSYLFCITATLQGFVLFIYFVIIDPATRSLWTSCGKTVNVDTSTT